MGKAKVLKIRNLTTDDLGYQGVTFPAKSVTEVDGNMARKMIGAMPDKFRLARSSNNRSMQDKQSANRMVN